MNRLPSLLLACATLVLTACGGNPAETAVPAVPDPVLQGQRLSFPSGHPQLTQLGIVAATPARTLTVDLPARLVWNEDHTQRIYPAFAGRVSQVQGDVGQAVRAGSLLAQVASPEFGVAQADTAKAQADAQLTQTALVRQRQLFEAGVIARKDLEQAEADAARARAEVQRAEARTRLYGGHGGSVDQRLALVAGIAGVIVERNITPSQELRPEQSGPGVPPLFVISDPSSLWVVLDARETEVGVLKPGTRFELLVPTLPGQKFEGRVIATGDFIDPATRTIRVRGLVANPQRLLKSEMLATARITREIPSGVMVPTAAVRLEGAAHWVMVQVAPGAFEQREVSVGYQGQGETLVTLGLVAGDKVVAQNMLMLARQYRLALDAARPAAVPAVTAPALPAASATTPTGAVR
ncbi:MAG: hypothetical protein RL522_817 [Pseudomonadota bacterium]